MESLSGKVELIEQKKGKSTVTEKEWTLFIVTINGIKFKTFNELLLQGILIGDEVFIEYEEVIKDGFKTNRIYKITHKLEHEESNKILCEQLAKLPKVDKVVEDEEDAENCELIIGEKKYKGLIRRIK